MMRRYPWPGNVRELENLVRRLAALYPQEEISPEIIETELKSELAKPDVVPAGGGDMENISISQAVEQNMQRYFASFGADLPPPGLYHRVLAELEYPLILACLTATRGNQIKAADLLGLNRNTLRKKIRELGVNIYRGNKGN
jgi:two-component system nitrogen regulation response regulator GlnG